MDIGQLVEDAVIRRTEQLLVQQFEQEHWVDVDKAMRQAMSEVTVRVKQIVASYEARKTS